jgi:hypothetical protein
VEVSERVDKWYNLVVNRDLQSIITKVTEVIHDVGRCVQISDLSPIHAPISGGGGRGAANSMQPSLRSAALGWMFHAREPQVVRIQCSSLRQGL